MLKGKKKDKRFYLNSRTQKIKNIELELLLLCFYLQTEVDFLDKVWCSSVACNYSVADQNKLCYFFKNKELCIVILSGIKNRIP